MHKTFFHWGHNDIILFKDWVLHTPKETFFTSLLFVLLGIGYHGIKFVRQRYGRKCQNTKCKRYILSKGHLLQTMMHIVQFLWGYCLMLSVMTYNSWLMIAVLAGFGLGYFFFGWGEFEDRSGSLCLQKTPSSCRSECNATCSSQSTQKLLLNENSPEVVFEPQETSAAIGCNCDDSAL